MEIGRGSIQISIGFRRAGGTLDVTAMLGHRIYQGELNMRRISLYCLLSLFVIAAIGSANAKTLRVPSSSYPTISSAVAAAQPNDKIQVGAGTYREQVVVAVDNVQIIGSTGAILDGTGLGAGMDTTGFQVFGESVTVQGFAIRNYTLGFTLFPGGGRIIRSNCISNCGIGIDCTTGVGVAASSIDHNTVCGSGTGIHVLDSDSVTVGQNLLVGNGLNSAYPFQSSGFGLALDSDTACTVFQNVILASNTDGINALFCDTTSFSQNTCSGNGTSGLGNGMDFIGAFSCTVDHNLVTFNTQDGIFADSGSAGNAFTHNTGYGNGAFDAEDQNLVDDQNPGQNTWAHNTFVTKTGF